MFLFYFKKNFYFCRMIQKKCKCGCGKYPTIGYKGFNYNCAPTEVREFQLQKRLAYHKKTRERQIEKHKNKPHDFELDKWFELVASVIKANPKCWECGAFIPPKYYKAASAHILKKSKFTSVKYHPLNFLILGGICGCHNKSETISTFATMKVWGIAVKRFLQFEHLIKETDEKDLFTFKSFISENPTANLGEIPQQ